MIHIYFLLYYLNVYFITFLWAILVHSASICLQIYLVLFNYFGVHFWRAIWNVIDHLFSHSELTDPCNDSVLVMGEHAGHTSRMLYGTTIMQTLSKVYRALPHAVYTFRVNQLYRVYRVYTYIVSFNRVIDILYFKALLLMRLIWGSHCKVSGAILDTMQYTTFQKGLFLSECLPSANGEDLCKCFLGKFRLAKTGGQFLPWDRLRSDGQIQSNYHKTTFWLYRPKINSIAKKPFHHWVI